MSPKADATTHVYRWGCFDGRFEHVEIKRSRKEGYTCKAQWLHYVLQWKPLNMITLGPALFDNNNRLIILSGGYKNLHYITQFIVTTFYMYKKQQNLFKKLM